jgi:hypothetical protein
MRIHPRLAAAACLAVLGVVDLLGAPAAAADCNDSSDTTVCAQGDIRGTHGPPAARPTQGPWGSWCNDRICYPGYVGGITLGP